MPNLYDASPKDVKEHLDGGNVLELVGDDQRTGRARAIPGEENAYCYVLEYANNSSRTVGGANGITELSERLKPYGPIERWELR